MNYLHIHFHRLAGGLMFLTMGSFLGCGPGEMTTVAASDSDSDSDSEPSTSTVTSSGSGSDTSTTTAGPTDTGDTTHATSDTEATTDDTQTTGETETDSNSDTDTDTETGTETDTGGLDCPQPEEVTVQFMLTPEVDEVDVDCVIAGVEDMGEEFTIELTCDQETYSVWFSASSLELPGGVAAESEVHLVYASSPGELGPNRWLALQHDGHGGQYKSILGGVSAATLHPPGDTFGDFFIDPVVTVVNNVCDPIDMQCGPVERVGLHFMDDIQEATIFDQGAGYYSGDFVSISLAAVSQAVVQVENNCDQGSATWFEFGWSWVWFGP